MGTGSFARQSEAPINRHSTFAKSAGVSATQEPLEVIPSLRSVDREQSPSATPTSALRGRTSGSGQDPDLRTHEKKANAENANAENVNVKNANAENVNVKNANGESENGEKKKRKRYLLLLLLLLVTFFVAYLGLSGFFGSGGEAVSAPVASTIAAPAPAVLQTATPEKVTAEESPKAIPAKSDAVAAPPVVEDERLPEERIAPSMIPARIADVTMPETQYNITYPEPIPPPPAAVKSKTNFVAFEVNAKLAEDADTRVFTMVPSVAGKGVASLAWSTLTGAVLFRCKDLAGNTAGSNYVLYYIDENDKAQRMMAFAVASGAELMLIPPRIPARGVKRVVLTLEKNVKTLEGMALRREEILYSDYKEKAILSKPLK